MSARGPGGHERRMTARPERVDSRRLTGLGPLAPGPGAVLTVRLPDTGDEDLIDRWREELRRTLRALEWPRTGVHVRRHPDGADLAFEAPRDVLYTATEVNEYAWDRAVAEWQKARDSGPAGSVEERDAALARLAAEARRERNPRVLELARAADLHGVTFLSDDDEVSVGSGRGSRRWPVGRIPRAEDVDWTEVSDVPVALVTGSNGKTTTVRLLAEVVAAAGRVPGFCCTDGIYVDGRQQDGGDWSGPGGGRAVLRHPDVDLAVLEVARGGLLRRGLASPRADAAVVTNVAADHLGEWGVHDVESIARVKLTVGRAVPDGRLVLNADDDVLMDVAAGTGLTWLPFTLDEPGERAHPADWCLLGAAVVRRDARGVTPVVAVDDIPIVDGGRARFNLYNAVAAAAVAERLGVADGAIAEGLQRFQGDPGVNPGRANRLQAGGVQFVVDFAHNPHGVRALASWARQLPAGRRLTMVGQAGDRDDASIRALARATLDLDPDLVVVKAMPEYRRGRDAGEVTRLLTDALTAAGFGADRLRSAASEMDAVRLLVGEARRGDLVVLPVQAARTDVLALLHSLEARGWEAGEAL